MLLPDEIKFTKWAETHEIEPSNVGTFPYQTFSLVIYYEKIKK
jgi:hypothetical protein